LQQREEEARSLAGQIHQLQVSRDALLEEVNFLSMRNAQMEEQLSGLPNLKQEALASRKRVDVLLEIVGEKEEEIEAVMADLQEVKNLYRAQIEELMDKVLLLSGQDSRSGPGAGSGDVLSVSSGTRGAPFGSMTQ
jgi:TATA element modulatory factor